MCVVLPLLIVSQLESSTRDINERVIRVASDCLNAVTKIQNGTMGVCTHIAKEINDARNNFEAVEFCHEGRRSNGEAHRLARSPFFMIFATVCGWYPRLRVYVFLYC
jgi:hypothetical protein